jgi:hypothetical protein
MGLDIYLSGRSYRHLRSREPEHTIDGMPIEEVRVKLGYWRKDWTLHNAFCALLEDGCEREVSVSANELRSLLGLVQSQALKDDDGESYTGEGRAEYGTEDTVEVLQRAIEWIEKQPENEWRDALYRGSW